jgi:hypothetical protein
MPERPFFVAVQSRTSAGTGWTAAPTLRHDSRMSSNRRTRFNSMAPVPEVTYLVVLDQYTKPLFVRELPPNTDPRMVMIEAMSRSIREGFEVEELPGTMPLYFCRKDGERRQVSIAKCRPR